MAVYDISSKELGAIGSYTDWSANFQKIQEAGYEHYWKHIESYKARNYELISEVHAPKR